MTNAQRIADAAALIGRPNDEFYTYAEWQKRGYQVQRGQKAVLSVKLWIPRKKKDDDEEKRTRFIQKTSHLFGREQVAPIGQSKGAA